MLADISIAPMLFNIIDRNAVKESRMTAKDVGLFDDFRILTEMLLKIPDFSAPFTKSIIPMMTIRISMSMKSRNSQGRTDPIINDAPAAKSAVYALSIPLQYLDILVPLVQKDLIYLYGQYIKIRLK